jgi:phosphoglycerol transferase
MKIGFLNPWQNAAENQIFQSLAIAAARIGHQIVPCANSMEVAAQAPEFVIAAALTQPKLNDIPHYSVVHAPRSACLVNRTFYANILSCDGYLTIADTLARFVRDLTFAVGRPQEAGYFSFCPQRLDIQTDIHALIASSRLKITYLGTNWDSQRAEVVCLLSRHDGVEVFGPEQSWTGLDPKSYGGISPFDGVSAQKKYAENGIGLCLLSEEHCRDDIISNRIFEIASVGALAICSDIPWLRRNFGDSLYYVDQSLPHASLVRQILLRREEIYRDPAAAVEKARCAREIFERRFAAEILLENTVAYHQRVSAQRQANLAIAANHAPLISVIIRCGSRPIEVVRRAIESLARQSYGRFDVILVRHSQMDVSPVSSLSFPNIQSIRVVDSPAGKRSSSLCAGLAAVQGEYFSVLDDDDWHFSNHFETLFHPVSSPPPRRFLAYSGTITAQPDPSPIAGGGSDNRQLTHFGISGTEDLFAISGAFTSNCFVASSNLLNSALLADPQLVTCEDSYLILSLLAQIDPKFSYAATTVYESGRPDQSGFARDPLRFDDELTVQIRLHGCALPRPGLAIGFAALSEFWKRRPAPKAPQIPAEVYERIAAGFDPTTSNIRPGCTVANPATGECLVETAPEPWAYSAEFALGIPAGRSGSGFIHLEVLVTCGPIGIGALNPAGTDFQFRIALQQFPEEQSVDIPVSGFQQTGRLVIQNWDTPGVHAARIRTIAVWALPE